MVSTVSHLQPTAPILHATTHGIDATRLNSSSHQKVADAFSKSGDQAQGESVDLVALTKKLNDIAKKSDTAISFSYNEKLNSSIITVIDQKSGKVIRKLPSEEAIKFAESIKDELGKLLDRRG